jgi:hypothetical protein
MRVGSNPFCPRGSDLTISLSRPSTSICRYLGGGGGGGSSSGGGVVVVVVVVVVEEEVEVGLMSVAVVVRVLGHWCQWWKC